jgi:hypothetical protein
MGIIVTFGTFASMMSDDYATLSNPQISIGFITPYNNTKNIIAETEILDTQIQQANLGTSEASSSFYGDIVNAIKLIKPSLASFSTMITSMSQTLYVPPLWVGIAVAILIIMFVTTMIFMIFKPG